MYYHQRHDDMYTRACTHTHTRTHTHTLAHTCTRTRKRARTHTAYLMAKEGSNMSIFGRNSNTTDINGFARGGWGLVHAFSNLNSSFSNLASDHR